MTNGEKKPDHVSWRLGDWIIDPDLNLLQKNGVGEVLAPMSINVLVYLVEAAPRVVSMEELLRQFWPKNYSDESAVHRRITQIRRSLGDNARDSKYIETVSKRGYRIVATVEHLGHTSPSTATETVEGLRSRSRRSSMYAVAGLTSFVLAITMVTWYALFRPATESGQPAQLIAQSLVPRIAVLPFASFSPNGNDQYFADGFQDDILSQLSRRELEVISRTSTSRYVPGDSLPSMRTIATDLNVTHVLEGSVRRSGAALRIVVQLIDAVADRPVWASTFDRPMEDLFVIQSEVADAVAVQLGSTFDIEPVLRAPLPPTLNIDAYDLLLQSRELLSTYRLANLRKAEELLEQALALDPQLAEAHATLAEVLLSQTFAGIEWAQVSERSLSSSARALEIDPNSAWAHYVRAHIESQWHSDIPSARAHYQRTFEIAPDNARLLTAYGTWLTVYDAQPQQALPILRRGLELDPLSAAAHYGLARALIDVRQLEEAVEVVEHGRQYNPDVRSLVEITASIQFARGDLFEFLAAGLHLIELVPNNPEPLSIAANVLLSIGEPEAAKLWIDRIATNTPAHMFWYTAQANLLAHSLDGAGIEQLAERWDSMNSDRRRPLYFDGASVPVGARLLATARSLQANIAHASERMNEARLLRRSAIEIAEPLLVGETGEPLISIWNLYLAIEHAKNLLLLDPNIDVQPLLRAVLAYNDSHNEAITARFEVMLLLGDTEGALAFVEANGAFVQREAALLAIRDNRFGLFDNVAGNPRFLAFVDQVVSRHAALRTRLRTELPTLMDATHGLSSSASVPIASLR